MIKVPKIKLSVEDLQLITEAKAQLEALRMTGLMSCLNRAVDIIELIGDRAYEEGRISRSNSGDIQPDVEDLGGEGG